jgi:hypothetical protein
MYGDYVKVLDPHPESGKRGYVVEELGVGIVRIFLHEHIYNPLRNGIDTEVDVPTNCLETIRSNGQEVMTRVCDYMTGDFPCLGKVASSFSSEESRINPDSAHGRLSRPCAQDLPGPHASDKVFFTKKGEVIFNKVYRGDFFVRWNLRFDPAFFSKRRYRAPLTVGQSPFVAEIEVIIESQSAPSNVGSVQYIFTRDRGMYPEHAWDDVLNLTSSQSQALAWRATHHLLRVVGCDLGFLLRNALLQTSDAYTARSWWKERLDLAITWADIIVQTMQPPLIVVDSLRQVTEALVVCNRYQLTGEMRGQIASDYEDVLSVEEVVTERIDEGDAFRNCHENAEAVVAYLHALRYLVKRQKNACFVLPEYYHVIREVVRLYHGGDDQTTMREGYNRPVGSVLAGLLIADEFRVGLCPITPEIKTEMISILLPSYRKKTEARKALSRAYATVSVDDFNEAILSCKREGGEFESYPSVYATFIHGRFKSGTEHKKSLRDSLREQVIGGAQSQCDNPGCRQDFVYESELRRCSKCKASAYCSRECQVAHWKAHKILCKSVSDPNVAS